jgi:hypothetical protein
MLTAVPRLPLLVTEEKLLNFLMLKINLCHEDMWVSEYMTTLIFILDTSWRVRLRVLFNDAVNY